MGAQGTATVDFGSFPGTDIATLTITGQTGILTSSLVEAWLVPKDTADHSEDEHVIEPPNLFVAYSSIVAGTGFTITAIAIDGLAYGTYSVAWVWN